MGCISSRPRGEKTNFPPPSRSAHEVESEERIAAMAQRAKEAREVAERAAHAERRAAERAVAAEKNAAVKAAEALEAQARADAQVQREAELKLKKLREKAEDDAYEAAVKQAFIDGVEPPPPPPPRFNPSTKMLEVPPVHPEAPPEPLPVPFSIARDPVVAARASLFEGKEEEEEEEVTEAPVENVTGERAKKLVNGFENMGNATPNGKRSMPGAYTPHAPNGVARNLRAQFEGLDRAPTRAAPTQTIASSPGRAVASKLAGFDALEAAAHKKPTLRPVQPARFSQGISSQVAGYEARDNPSTARPTRTTAPVSPGTAVASKLAGYDALEAAANAKPALRNVSRIDQSGNAAVASKLSAYEELHAASRAKPALRSVENVERARGISRQLEGYEALDAAAIAGPTGVAEPHSPGADVASKLAGYDALETAANTKPKLRNVERIDQGYNGISWTRAEYERRDAEAARPLPPPEAIPDSPDGAVAGIAGAYDRLDRAAHMPVGHHDVGAIETRQARLYKKAGLPVSPVTPERGLRPLSLPKFADPVLDDASPVADTRALFEQDAGDERYERPVVPVEKGRARRVAGIFSDQPEEKYQREKVVTGVSRNKLLGMLSAYEEKDRQAAEEMAIQDVGQRMRVSAATMQAMQTAE